MAISRFFLVLLLSFSSPFVLADFYQKDDVNVEIEKKRFWGLNLYSIKVKNDSDSVIAFDKNLIVNPLFSRAQVAKSLKKWKLGVGGMGVLLTGYSAYNVFDKGLKWQSMNRPHVSNKTKNWALCSVVLSGIACMGASAVNSSLYFYIGYQQSIFDMYALWDSSTIDPGKEATFQFVLQDPKDTPKINFDSIVKI